MAPVSREHEEVGMTAARMECSLTLNGRASAVVIYRTKQTDLV